jgi:FkbM family methyltransferase
MLIKRIKISFTKLLLPLLSIVFRLLNGNSRVINYLTLNRYKANDSFDFQEKIDKIISNKKMIALDVGSQGGFNSDVFFSKKYEKYFKSILVDPLKDSSIKEGFHYINKGFWSSKEKKKIYILGKRPGSSSMYEPDKNSLKIYGFKEKDFHLFDVTETKTVECDTISSNLKSINIQNLDYLKIDTQGAELEILKGLGDYRPLLIKCEIQIFPMYKNIPSWTELLNYLYNLDYMLSDWREIGSHSTRTPVEMDMIFIPNFTKASGKKIILDKQKEFVSLMLMCGQIKLLKKISQIIDLEYSEHYKNLQDRYFQ